MLLFAFRKYSSSLSKHVQGMSSYSELELAARSENPMPKSSTETRLHPSASYYNSVNQAALRPAKAKTVSRSSLVEEGLKKRLILRLNELDA